MDNDKQKNVLKISHHLENDSVLRVFLLIFIPTFLLMFAMVLNNFIDSILISSLTQDNYDPGGNLSYSIGTSLQSYGLSFLGIFTAMVFTVAIGTNILYANYIGRGKTKKQNRDLVQQSIWQNIIFAIVVMSIPVMFANLYSDFVINSSTSFSNSTYSQDLSSYIMILSLAYVFIAINSNFLRIARSEGHIYISSLISLIPIFINPLFDYILMGVFGFGISGAALATLISNVFLTLFFLTYIHFLIKKDQTNINFQFKFKFNKMFWVLIALGMAATFRRLATSFEQISLLFIIRNLRPIPGYDQELWSSFFNAVIRVNMLFIVGGLAASQSATQMIAYFYSNKDKEKLKRTIFTLIVFIVLVQSVSLLISVGLSPYILKLFGINAILDDPVLRKTLVLTYFIISLGFLLESISFVPNAFFNAIKKTKTNSLLIFITKIVSFVILEIIFVVLYWQLPGMSPPLLFSFLIINGIFTILFCSVFMINFFNKSVTIKQGF